MKSLTIRIENELLEELKKIAEAENRSLSSLIRLILKKGTGANAIRSSSDNR